MELLTVENLSFSYATGQGPALREVCLSLAQGDFALLTGPTGCGKSTLLRLLKTELAPRGERQGSIRFRGREPETMDPRERAAAIAYVAQRPEEQIVTDRVWHELAFGMENLGVPEGEMRRRVAETAQFFGLEEAFELPVDRLSGGQKQLLNLAAATVMMPELLLLDEPTSRLDPISADRFLSALERLNRETGMTILMAEHRLEGSLSRANRLMLMENGRILLEGCPRDVCGKPEAWSGTAEDALPAAARLWHASGGKGSCPLSTGEGRSWIAQSFPSLALGAGGKPIQDGPLKTGEEGGRSGRAVSVGKRGTQADEAGRSSEALLAMREVHFRFEREGKDILRAVSFRAEEGRITTLLGGNGSGKTTLLRMGAGFLRPYSGEIRLFGKRAQALGREEMRRHGVALMPQDPQTLFLRASVREELKDSGIRPEEAPFGLGTLLDRHPYDLSGGEQHLLGLAKVLASGPRLLLLDEPTSGLDGAWRRKVLEVLRTLREEGTGILMVTHDAEFAAEASDRCGLLFHGQVEPPEEPHAFFAGGSYYMPPVTRMIPGCVTVAEAAALLREASRA